MSGAHRGATAASPLETAWARDHAEWRDPADVLGMWQQADRVDPSRFTFRTRGDWWGVLAATGATLLVTREYEHLVLALRATPDGTPAVSYLPVPHPSGLAVDRAGGVVHLASTRNPNLLYELRPIDGRLERIDAPARAADGRRPALGDAPTLLPSRARFLPGCLYLHDLALVGGELYGNAVGMNAVVRFGHDGRVEPVWWPRAIETERGPAFEQNYLQLNSIAAGDDLSGSFFSASAARPARRRPGHLNFPVDGKGVIFSGATREPIAGGLTRPHSARLHRGRVWVDNSGYGTVGVVADGRYDPVAALPGWTRGLCFHGDVAFVGTSRVIPRFSRYAPGLDPARAVCGVHALDTRSGRVLGSLLWPTGNQIFAIDWAPSAMVGGFPFERPGAGRSPRTRAFLYAYKPAGWQPAPPAPQGASL
jgi:uncharacterized protein (TIGR03032 family)